MKVILITGKMCSGKSTLAGYLDYILTERGYRVKRYSLASPLKKIAMDYFHVDKDLTLANEHFEIDKAIKKFEKNFALNLPSNKKEALKILLTNYHVLKLEEAGRKILQFIGTEIFRKEVHEYFWREYAIFHLKNFEKEKYDFVIIDDWRFPNEDVSDLFDTVRIRISTTDEERKRRCPKQPIDTVHESEAYIDSLSVDYEVKNYKEVNLEWIL